MGFPPERLLQVLREHLTLTPRERRVVGFVLGSLVAGLLVRELGFRYRLPEMTPPAQVSGERGSPPPAEASRAAAFSQKQEPSPRPPEPRRVNLNQAGLADLIALPGIGPQKARRILEYRRTHGPFRRVQDLLAVPGIGPRTLEKLRPLVTVE